MGRGRFSFPGVTSYLNCQFTVGQGNAPGVGTIEVPFGAPLPARDGDLVFTWDGQEVVRHRNVRVGSAQRRRSGNGIVIVYQLIGRQWKWADGEISGRYNVRKKDETVDSDTEKTPRELATLLLQAMGESGFDVSALPNDARPFVDWDVANPAQELQGLCDSFGCRFVMDLATDSVRIVRAGQGATLPIGGQLIGGGDGIDPVETADWVSVVCGPTRYQCRIPLEAVGLDSDGTIQLIDDLSYKPSGGWGNEYPQDMGGVAATSVTMPDGTKATARNLAIQTVFRWYRVLDNVVIPPLATEESLEVSRKRILPLADTLVDTYRDADGKKLEQPAFIDGTWWYEGNPENDAYQNSTEHKRLNLDFSIDQEKGIVKFNEPVVKLDRTNGKQEEADLYLWAGFTVRDKDTNQITRYKRERGITPNATSSSKHRKIIRRDEIAKWYKVTYSGSDVQGMTNNKDDVDKEADYYIAAEIASYNRPVSEDREFGYLLPIQPDGAIVQVTWRAGLNGATTRASRTTEHDFYAPTYKEAKKRYFDYQAAQLAKSSAFNGGNGGGKVKV